MNKSFSQRSLPVVLLLSGSLLFTTGCTDGGASAAQSGPSHPGKAVYNDYCYSCHNACISGAPRLGDVDEWRPRIAKGKALLLASTVNGLAPGMPARGLCYSCTDEELSQSVDYMIERAQPLPAE
ncbi:MAG: c-type cytochrome [Pseudomonadales bacterium]